MLRGLRCRDLVLCCEWVGWEGASKKLVMTTVG